jgi:hypothetical protein
VALYDKYRSRTVVIDVFCLLISSTSCVKSISFSAYSRIHSHTPSIRSHRGTKVVWPDIQPMRVPEEPVCIDLFRQNPVFTSLQLKYPVHVLPPQPNQKSGMQMKGIGLRPSCALWRLRKNRSTCLHINLTFFESLFYINKNYYAQHRLFRATISLSVFILF